VPRLSDRNKMSAAIAVVSDDRDLLARQMIAIEEHDRLHRCIVPIVDLYPEDAAGGSRR